MARDSGMYRWLSRAPVTRSGDLPLGPREAREGGEWYGAVG